MRRREQRAVVPADDPIDWRCDPMKASPCPTGHPPPRWPRVRDVLQQLRPRAQGVVVVRLAWADRDNPGGRVTIWQDGVWLSPVRKPGVADKWEYPAGTPLVRTTIPWHDGIQAGNAFWGPSIHWNTAVKRYVMLLNRTKGSMGGIARFFLTGRSTHYIEF